MFSARLEFWTFIFGSSVVKFCHPCCNTSDLTPWNHLYHTGWQVLLLLPSASRRGKEVTVLLIYFDRSSVAMCTCHLPAVSAWRPAVGIGNVQCVWSITCRVLKYCLHGIWNRSRCFFITANLSFACHASLYLRLLQLRNKWCSGM